MVDCPYLRLNCTTGCFKGIIEVETGMFGSEVWVVL